MHLINHLQALLTILLRRAESHDESEDLRIIMKVILATNKKVNILKIRFPTCRYASLKSPSNSKIGLVLFDYLCVTT